MIIDTKVLRVVSLLLSIQKPRQRLIFVVEAKNLSSTTARLTKVDFSDGCFVILHAADAHEMRCTNE